MERSKSIKLTERPAARRVAESSHPLSRIAHVLPLAALAFVDCSGGSSSGDRAPGDGNAGRNALAGRAAAATGGTSSSASGGVSNGGSSLGGATTGGTANHGGANQAGGANQTGGASGTTPANGGAGGTAGSGVAGDLAQSGNAGATPNGGASSGGRGGNSGRGGGTSGGGNAAGAAGAAMGAAGQGSGGTSSTLPFSYYIGADVTDQEPQPDATRDNLLTIMKSHGFNYIRLRTFVDPKAADGYDQQNGYDDITHTVAFGKQIKDAGMGLLVDFHYSDNWADPGKQCVPVAWQSYTAIADLATAVHDYTKDAITKLVAGGARPDMVQIGNEITPGMLIHRCDSSGHPTGENPITGKVSNWTNLGALLKAGAQGVKDVDPTIVISLHIDQGDGLATSKSFISNAQTQGVAFDAFGESCYTAYQGQPSGWQNTFDSLATDFPKLKLFIAEYGPEQRAANDMIFGLANDQGIGTFNWEPTTQGDWNTGHDLLRRSGSTYTAQPDLALYDQMKVDYASRL
jgi:arabinogalactan endo-1,4-beta-galactosidase